MGRVGVVVDSTADLDPSYYAEHDVVMVPLTVRFGEEAFLDWIDLKPDEFYERLSSCDELPKTSQPSVAQFADAYNDLASSCESIISIHLSSELSGTVSSAQAAAGQMDVPVAIVDTRLASSGIGLVLSDVVAARDRGASHDELVAVAERRSKTVTTLFYVQTLRYLEMGGRIGKAAALAGSLLRIRPVLKLDDGVVAPYKKVKGSDRVFREFVGAIQEVARGRRVKGAFLHAAAPESIETLRKMLQEAGVDFEAAFVSKIGSVIGTYIGPGAFGVVFYPDGEQP